MDINKQTIETLPTVALRGMTAFPDMLLHFDVERPMSVAAIHAALGADQRVFLLTQREMLDEVPSEAELYTVGTICKISQVLRVPGHGMRVMVEGLCRAEMQGLVSQSPYFLASVTPLEDVPAARRGNRTEALLRQCLELFEVYMDLSGSQGELAAVFTSDDPGYVADYIAQNIAIRHEERQSILEERRPVQRMQKIVRILVREVEILEIKTELAEETSHLINQNQRDYYLREQARVIREALGEAEDDEDELEEYKAKVIALGLVEESQEKLLKEVTRLGRQAYGSSEAAVIRTYLDTVLELPWNTATKERVDIAAARKVLEADHFGMEKVKARVIEFLAVRQLAPDVKGGILCLVGPPGVGKTSIASSVAKALGRNFARISLGGVHDEAEIRGHRKTYVGAMPGRIMAAVRQAKSKNPLLLLDEIDKLGRDHRGDPASALLEALDSEQNNTFRDHYLELSFDLSETLFITTANSTDSIPRPLLDRMEVIELGSYTDEEKLQIAQRHLLPKQRKRHGLTARQLKIRDDAVRDIIAGYTRESGVRQLERELTKVCRKTAAAIVEGELKSRAVTTAELHGILGVRKYSIETVSPVDEVGLAHGLAWTRVGGEMLTVEAQALDGSGKLELTGNLGNVMQESAKAALSYIRSRTAKLGIEPDFYKTRDIHIHFPEGAIPKDGPSAGITIAVAMVSALMGAPVRRDLAMTGEITLRGRVLEIGGLKEKTMAALRNDIRTVLIPAENERDLEEIDPTVRAALQIVLVDHMDVVLETALCLPEVKAAQGKLPRSSAATAPSGRGPKGKSLPL
ncbi:MAG: endopeptidase La [Oscillospiraceae bacterium]|nr:endopeptidase La [Oscillospiraceae bacterium]